MSMQYGIRNANRMYSPSGSMCDLTQFSAPTKNLLPFSAQSHMIQHSSPAASPSLLTQQQVLDLQQFMDQYAWQNYNGANISQQFPYISPIVPATMANHNITLQTQGNPIQQMQIMNAPAPNEEWAQHVPVQQQYQQQQMQPGMQMQQMEQHQQGSPMSAQMMCNGNPMQQMQIMNVQAPEKEWAQHVPVQQQYQQMQPGMQMLQMEQHQQGTPMSAQMMCNGDPMRMYAMDQTMVPVHQQQQMQPGMQMQPSMRMQPDMQMQQMEQHQQGTSMPPQMMYNDPLSWFIPVQQTELGWQACDMPLVPVSQTELGFQAKNIPSVTHSNRNLSFQESYIPVQYAASVDSGDSSSIDENAVVPELEQWKSIEKKGEGFEALIELEREKHENQASELSRIGSLELKMTQHRFDDKVLDEVYKNLRLTRETRFGIQFTVHNSEIHIDAAPIDNGIPFSSADNSELNEKNKRVLKCAYECHSILEKAQVYVPARDKSSKTLNYAAYLIRGTCQQPSFRLMSLRKKDDLEQLPLLLKDMMKNKMCKVMRACIWSTKRNAKKKKTQIKLAIHFEDEQSSTEMEEMINREYTSIDITKMKKDNKYDSGILALEIQAKHQQLLQRGEPVDDCLASWSIDLRTTKSVEQFLAYFALLGEYYPIAPKMNAMMKALDAQLESRLNPDVSLPDDIEAECELLMDEICEQIYERDNDEAIKDVWSLYGIVFHKTAYVSNRKEEVSRIKKKFLDMAATMVYACDNEIMSLAKNEILFHFLHNEKKKLDGRSKH